MQIIAKTAAALVFALLLSSLLRAEEPAKEGFVTQPLLLVKC